MRNLRNLNGSRVDSRWLVAVALVTLLSLAFTFAPSAQADALAAPPAQGGSSADIISNDGLLVESGRTINGDAVVFSGDVVVEDGGVVDGDLVVMSGNLDVEEGARITGDTVLFSGNAEIDGEIKGDLALWSGNVDLGGNAIIGGDVSMFSGNLDRNDDAVISGSITNGPNLNFSIPFLNSALGAAGQDAANQNSDSLEAGQPDRVVQIERGPGERSNRGGFGGWLLRTLARFFRAALYVGLLTLAASVLTISRPAYVHRVRDTARRSLAPAFALGLVVTLVLGVFFFLLRFSWCFLPLALLPVALLLALNVAGWAALGLIVGEEIKQRATLSLDEGPTVAVGVTLVAGLIGTLGALGLCFTPLSWLLLIVASSIGVGAVLLPWTQRLLGNGGTRGTSPSGSGSILSVPDGPSDNSEQAATGAAAYTPPVQSFTQTDESASPESTSSESTSTTELPTQSQQESSMRDEQPSEDITADDITPADGITPADTAAAETLGAAPEEVQQLESGGEPDTEQAAQVEQAARDAGRTESDDSTEDDLTRIQGIGETFDRRFKEAGVRTFVDLANMTPDAVSEIIGWSPERVQRDDLIGQARTLASEGEV